MEMWFVRHEPCYGRIMLVLALDRQKKKERILIGEETHIRLCLQGNTDADVLCDVTHPLGTFLAGFEHDPDGEWNRLGLAPLREALHTNRWRQPALEQAAGGFLEKKYLTGDPVRMYAAFRIWNGYLLARQPRERAEACERFMDGMARLTAVFQEGNLLRLDPESGKPERFHAASRVFGSVPAEETRLELWYPDNKRTVECVATYDSLCPMITYYLNRLNDWGLYFRKCKVCGRLFLAESLRYELCGSKCRKAQALQNKREFDERARDNSYDLSYKNECQHWRNIINKAKKKAGFPAERLAAMQAAFEAFRREALQRKRAIRTEKASPKEFTDWLYQQNSIILNLLDGS